MIKAVPLGFHLRRLVHQFLCHYLQTFLFLLYWLAVAKLYVCNSLLPLQQVHNRNLLSLDFDRITRTEKVYDDHRKFTLRIHYDHAGRPTLWAPSSRLNGVNVTYSSGGHVAGIQRGTMSVRMEYDQNGRITSQIFADGKSWSYTYLEKVWIVCVVLIANKMFGTCTVELVCFCENLDRKSPTKIKS